jgi:hypothetical protein
MVDMFWPLCVQGTITEDSGLCGGGKSAAVHTREKIVAEKSQLFISPIVSLIDISIHLVKIKICSILYVDYKTF